MKLPAKEILLNTLTSVCLLGGGYLLGKASSPSQPAPTPLDAPHNIEAPSDLNVKPFSINFSHSQLKTPNTFRAYTQNLEEFPGHWENNDHLFLPLKNQESVEVTFPSPEPYNGPLLLHTTQGPDFGSYEILLNQSPLAAGDGWSPKVRRKTQKIERASLKAGTNTLTITSTGKNTNSTGFFVALDCLQSPQ